MTGKYRVDGRPLRFFQMINEGGNPREWICKKCGLKRSNKQTHEHGKEMH